MERRFLVHIDCLPDRNVELVPLTAFAGGVKLPLFLLTAHGTAALARGVFRSVVS